MAKSKTKSVDDNANFSAILSDHNAQLKSGPDEVATPERGYQKSND